MRYAISIIIPVYNAERYLRQCLKSVIEQTISSKQIICIDDGSNDGSSAILHEYERNNENLIVLHQNNKGAGAARNEGLKKAQGEYISFLDADDYYIDAEALERMILACRNNNAQICGSFRTIKHEKTNQDEKFALHRELCQGHPKGVELKFREYQDDYHYQNYIFENDLLKKNHIFFPPYRRYQDPPFFLRAMLAAEKIWVLPVELYCLRLGHQDFAQHGKFIEHTLMGIRDNLVLAKKENLLILQTRLKNRVDNDFFLYIKMHMNSSILRLLVEINELLPTGKQPLKIIDRMLFCYDNYDNLGMSCYLNRVLLEARYKINGIGEFIYNDMGLKTVAVYGFGYIGTALYYELKDSRISICAIIDRRGVSVRGENCIHTIQEVPPCDAIIVTPIDDGESISQNIKNIVNYKVILFHEIAIAAENKWKELLS